MTDENQPSQEKLLLEIIDKIADGLKTVVKNVVGNFISTSLFGFGLFLGLHFYLNKQYKLALLSLPVTIVVGLMGAYFDNLIKSLIQTYRDRGTEDGVKLVNWLDNTDRKLKWIFSGIDDKYLQCQSYRCQDYETQGFKSPLSISTPLLKEVFVPLDLSKSFIRSYQGEYLPLDQGYYWDQNTIQRIEEKGFSIWQIWQQVNKYPALKSLAITAWGGYGKTTLLKHITYIYSNKKYKEYKVPQLLPVFLALGDYQKIITETEQLDLPTLIEQNHIPNLTGGKELQLPPHWAKKHLRKGTMLVMFDGFDEVKEIWRDDIIQWLAGQMQEYPHAYFILTSRPTAYNNIAHQYQLKSKLFVKPFNQQQKSDFINNWYWCQEKFIRSGRSTLDVKERAIANSNNLLAQLAERPKLDDLARNPLLLNIITHLHYSYPDEELPKRRGELYQDIIKLLLKDRPKARKITPVLPPDDAQKVLQKLALSMIINNQKSIAYQELLGQVTESVHGFDDSVNINKFIEQTIDVSELLIKNDENYRFAHLSFQGYLAGKEIIETKQENLLLENWHKLWWKETILLYSAQINPNWLLKELIEIGNDEAIKLAYQCSQETPRKIDEEVKNKFTNQVTDDSEHSNISAESIEQLNEIDLQIEDRLFAPLRNYLKNKQWKEADQETDRLMLQLGDKGEKGWLDYKNCDNFPKQELLTIDQLWLKYSDNHFGISIQKKIYLKHQGNLDWNIDSYWKMSDEIGWRNNKHYVFHHKYLFNKNAPEGHLPSLYKSLKVDKANGNGDGVLFSLLCSRL